MPRTVEVVVPHGQTERVESIARASEGLLGLRVQAGVSRKPPGDLITIVVTTRSLHPLLRDLVVAGIDCSSSASISTSEPLSLVSPGSQTAIVTDPSDATWEEMQQILAKESNMTVNALLLMAFAGALAVIGMVRDSVHLVIGAMVIAPGFEPIVRIGLSPLAGRISWRRGLADTVKAYLALGGGALVTVVVFLAAGRGAAPGTTYYQVATPLVRYWGSVSVYSVSASTIASLAGALLVATNRSILTAGVMIALGLIPSFALVPLGLVTGDFPLAARALLHWGVDVGLVIGATLLVSWWKRSSVYHREAMPHRARAA